MTQVEKLRTMSEALRGYSWGQSLSDYLDDAASEIEREHAEDCFRMGERAAEDRGAVAWVREHGGLDNVDAIWDNDVPLAEAVISELWPDGRPDECGNDDVMGELRRRLMPKGMEWPRYDTGEPVRFGDEFLDHQGNVRSVLSVKMYQEGGFEIGTGQRTYDWHSEGERVRRPAVLAADGKPLEVGQTVWHVTTGHEYTVRSRTNTGAHLSRDGKLAGYCRADHLTHQRPVLDADGVPINKGDTVYLLPGEWCDEFPCLGFHGGEELEVFADGEASHAPGSVQCREKGTGHRYTCYPQPSQLTHTKPEPPDSRQAVVNEIGDEMAARIDLLVSSGRWSDAD